MSNVQTLYTVLGCWARSGWACVRSQRICRRWRIATVWARVVAAGSCLKLSLQPLQTAAPSLNAEMPAPTRVSVHRQKLFILSPIVLSTDRSYISSKSKIINFWIIHESIKLKVPSSFCWKENIIQRMGACHVPDVGPGLPLWLYAQFIRPTAPTQLSQLSPAQGSLLTSQWEAGSDTPWPIRSCGHSQSKDMSTW